MCLRGVSLDKGERALDFAREIFREHHKEAKRSENRDAQPNPRIEPADRCSYASVVGGLIRRPAISWQPGSRCLSRNNNAYLAFRR